MPKCRPRPKVSKGFERFVRILFGVYKLYQTRGCANGKTLKADDSV